LLTEKFIFQNSNFLMKLAMMRAFGDYTLSGLMVFVACSGALPPGFHS
jgi:hypothetical protein